MSYLAEKGSWRGVVIFFVTFDATRQTPAKAHNELRRWSTLKDDSRPMRKAFALVPTLASPKRVMCEITELVFRSRLVVGSTTRFFRRNMCTLVYSMCRN